MLRRIRRLLAHYRATEPELPAWCEAFVTAGYAHYCTLLPTAFVDDETGVRQVGAMLGFLFTMESLALSLGCDRAQLELAVRQSHPESPAKVALLWAAQHQLGLLPLAELRARCADLLGNPLVVPTFPQYLSGFVQALEPAPTLAPFVVEVMSNAFARLPDPVLLPWLPTLITTLRDQAGELVPVLVREAGRTFPATLPAVDAWVPPWTSTTGTPARGVGPHRIAPRQSVGRSVGPDWLAGRSAEAAGSPAGRGAAPRADRADRVGPGPDDGFGPGSARWDAAVRSCGCWRSILRPATASPSCSGIPGDGGEGLGWLDLDLLRPLRPGRDPGTVSIGTQAGAAGA